MRLPGVFRLLLTLSLIAPAAVRAQDAIGNAAAGRRLATGWCSNCHGGDPSAAEPLMPAPYFAEIANRRDTTGYKLRVFLRTPHTRMPNYVLSPDEIDDLVAYIMSLRRTRR